MKRYYFIFLCGVFLSTYLISGFALLHHLVEVGVSDLLILGFVIAWIVFTLFTVLAGVEYHDTEVKS